MSTRGKSKKNDWHLLIEKLLREATRTIRFLPSRGCKPAGYGSSMPEVVRDRWDGFASQLQGQGGKVAQAMKSKVVRIGPTSAAISRFDYIHGCVNSADLTPLQRSLLWERAEGVPWKELCHRHNKTERVIRRHYTNATIELCAYIVASRRQSVSTFFPSRLRSRIVNS